MVVNQSSMNFAQTVERRMVHRTSDAEVFVTDLAGVDDVRYTAAARLPTDHAYYGDHRQEQAGFDPLLLLESCRQASTYGSHRQLGLPVDIQFLVDRWSIRLQDPARIPAGGGVGELYLEEVLHPTVRSGRIRGVRFDLGLRLAGEAIGSATIEVRCASREEYRTLREVQRGDKPPMTGDMTPPEPGTRPAPRLVGRTDPRNVVLADPTRTGDEVSATLSPRFDNGSLFDHDYDHYPAMVLMEAARQLVLLSIGDGADGVWLSGLDARFLRFAELDSPVVATTRAPTHDANEPWQGWGVRFVQNDALIAETTLTVTSLNGGTG
jgi:2-oxo-3-(phosphooxy)propyl 3-oxoalkanoate synthase